MRPKRSHSGTPSDIYHFFFGVFYKKLSVRTRNGDFVPGFLIKHVGRTDPWIHVTPTVFISIKWWCSYPDIEHDNVSFSRVIGHRIRPELGLIIDHLKIPQFPVVPLTFKLVLASWIVGQRSDVKIFKFH